MSSRRVTSDEATLTQRMLLRVYLHGILMLALATGASFVVGTYVLTPAVEVPRGRAPLGSPGIDELADRPEVLQQELSDLKRRARIEMTCSSQRARDREQRREPPSALGAAELRELPGERPVRRR